MTRWQITRKLLPVIPWLLLTIPLEILGLVVVAILIRYRDVPIEQMPKWSLPWVNPEDWTGGYLDHQPGDNCMPPDLRQEYKGAWGFYRYHALRNRAHGLRNYDWYVLELDENKIQYCAPAKLANYSDWFLKKYGFNTPGMAYWYIAWQDNRAGFKWIKFTKKRVISFKFGWRIEPTDAINGFNPRSIRWVYGVAPTISVRFRSNEQ